MGNVVRAKTCRGVDGYALGPEYRRRNLTPLLCITIGGLDQGFSDIEVSALDNSIGLGVVGRDTDVVDTIAVLEDLERGNVWSAVVRYNGFYCTVAAENVFEDEFGYSWSSLCEACGIRAKQKGNNAPVLCTRSHWIAASSLYLYGQFGTGHRARAPSAEYVTDECCRLGICGMSGCTT